MVAKCERSSVCWCNAVMKSSQTSKVHIDHFSNLLLNEGESLQLNREDEIHQMRWQCTLDTVFVLCSKYQVEIKEMKEISGYCLLFILFYLFIYLYLPLKFSRSWPIIFIVKIDHLLNFSEYLLFGGYIEGSDPKQVREKEIEKIQGQDLLIS